MAEPLHKLENNEAVLLMYLADELPAEDRCEVEQLLARDGALRAELEQIGALYGFAMESLRRLDEVAPLRAAEELAAKRVAALVHRTQIESLAKPPASPERQSRRVRWWHPLMGAAAAILVFLIWWGYAADTLPPGRLPAPPGRVANIGENPSGDVLVLDPSQREPDAMERHAMALAGDENGQIGSALWLPPEDKP